MPPAARVTDMHVCPMVTGVVPHVGGPILPPGVPTVLIDFLPAATVTDMATCVGPPDMIAMGSAGVFINFLPAARLGDQTVHGGVIVLGSPTCIIGEVGAGSPGAAGLGGIVAGLGIALNGVKSAVASILAVGSKMVAPLTDAVGKQAAEAGAKFLAGNPAAKQWLLDHAPSDTSQIPFDGDVIGIGCRPSGPDTAQTAQGIRPAKCPGGTGTIPRVYFANGINTKVYGPDASMCDTMQKIADQTCAEVVGIYGATIGLVPDLDQAVQEIDKNSNSAQAKTLSKLMTDSATSDPPQDLNIIAHSRGGLATQEALATTKLGLLADKSPEEADQALSHFNISAYGTAEQGWPAGPVYSKLNNAADPVPAAIKGAQSQFGDATLRDNDTTPTVLINEPQFNPLDAHSATDIYAKYMPKADGPRNCNCN